MHIEYCLYVLSCAGVCRYSPAETGFSSSGMGGLTLSSFSMKSSMTTTRSRSIGNCRAAPPDLVFVVAQERLAAELRLAVDLEPATAADEHVARPAIAERAVDLVLDVVERVENDPLFLARHGVGLEERLLVLLRAIAEDFDWMMRRSCCLTSRGGAVDALGRLRLGDDDVEIVDAWIAVRVVVRHRGASGQFVSSRFS